MAARGLTPSGDPRRRSGGGCSLACTVFPCASRAPIRRTGVAWRRRARKGTRRPPLKGPLHIISLREPRNHAEFLFEGPTHCPVKHVKQREDPVPQKQSNHFLRPLLHSALLKKKILVEIFLKNMIYHHLKLYFLRVKEQTPIHLSGQKVY